MKTTDQHREELIKKVITTKQVFQSPDGKSVLDNLRDEFATRSSHVPGDPYTSAYMEGQRSVILFIDDILESDYE